MNSEDDPRSIDWAPKQIEALKASVERLDRRITEAMERITSETCRFNRLREMHHDLVKQSADEIGALTDRVNGMVPYVELAERVLRLEQGIKSLSEQGNVDRDRINELQAAIASRVREELSAGFRDLEPEPEFSAPIGGGRAGDVADHTHLRGTGQVARHGGIFALSTLPGGVVPEVSFKKGSMASIFESSWERGYEAGRRAAVDEVQSRVGVVLDRSHIFNPATRLKIMNEIEAVLSTKTGNDALREEETALDQVIELNQEKARAEMQLAEQRVIAKCIEMGWHENSPATLGMVNALRGTKPIKDQPQG